jgi:hypothetical protein
MIKIKAYKGFSQRLPGYLAWLYTDQNKCIRVYYSFGNLIVAWGAITGPKIFEWNSDYDNPEEITKEKLIELTAVILDFSDVQKLF